MTIDVQVLIPNEGRPLLDDGNEPVAINHSSKNSLLFWLLSLGAPSVAVFIAGFVLANQKGTTVLSGLAMDNPDALYGTTPIALGCDAIMTTPINNSTYNIASEFISQILIDGFGTSCRSGLSSSGSCDNYLLNSLSSSGSDYTTKSMQLINAVLTSLITVCQQNPCTTAWRLFGGTKNDPAFTFSYGAQGTLTCSETTSDRINLAIIGISAVWLLLMMVRYCCCTGSRQETPGTPVEGTVATTPVAANPYGLVSGLGYPSPAQRTPSQIFEI